jgi:hypothetical protein
VAVGMALYLDLGLGLVVVLLGDADGAEGCVSSIL